MLQLTFEFFKVQFRRKCTEFTLEPFIIAFLRKKIYLIFIGYNSWACKRRDRELIIIEHVNNILESDWVGSLISEGGGVNDTGIYFLLQ